MKLISLNIWGGKVFKPLMNFIKDQSNDTDILCFQEVFDSPINKIVTDGLHSNIYSEIEKILPDFKGYYTPALKGFDFDKAVDFKLSFGLAIFVKKSISVKSHGDIFVYGSRNQIVAVYEDYFSMPKNLQYIRFKNGNKQFIICNFHGTWYPGTKVDSEDRIKQSKKIKKFLDKQKGAKILCGDFNLLPNTKSLKILEEDMINLIKKFKIKDTRGRLHEMDIRFADYTLVSPEVEVIDFKVPNVAISDHLPMVLEFN